jgi:cell division protein FtsA
VTSKTKYIGAVEIGTHKVTVFVGELSNGRSLNIIGFGECHSRGVIKGNVVDFRAASESAHSALLSAEQKSGVRIDEVFLAQTGGHLEGFYNEASVSVSAADNMVSAMDVDTVCRLAKAKSLPEGRMVVHNIRRPFRLDGRLLPDPENLVGQRLDVGYWTVHGSESKIADNIHVVRGLNVPVAELILSSLASGTMVTSAEDRQNGALVIDVGAGTTDYVLYRDGGGYLTGVVPVGGSHITNDLSLGLRLTEGQADKLKLRFGSAIVQTRDKAEKVWLNGDYAIGDRQFPKQAIEQITSARIWEIFEVVKKKLGTAWDPERVGAGVILTGGTAKTPGIAEAAAKVFGVMARVGELPGYINDNVRDPGYATGLGLLYLGMNSANENRLARPKRANFFQKLFT